MMKEVNKPTMKSLESLEKRKKSTLISIIKEHRNYVAYLESKLGNVKEMIDKLNLDISAVRRTEKANKEENVILLQMLSDIKVSIKTAIEMRYPEESPFLFGGDLPYQPMAASAEGESRYSDDELEIVNLLKLLHRTASV